MKMQPIICFYLALIFIHSHLNAQTKYDPWTFSSTTHFWLKEETTSLQKTPLTSIDSPFAIPKDSKGLLIQEDFLAKNESKEWVFRPSIGIDQETYQSYPEDSNQLKNKLNTKINELYFLYQLNSIWTFSVGLQNYQWGPAELMSPSNPLFHFSSNSQDPSFQIQGHSLLRFNYTPNENVSLVSLYEFAKNEEKSFIHNESFVPKGLIKTEFRFSNPTDYLGFSIGNEQMHDPFLGEYGNFTFKSDFSFYFDFKQTRISKRYHPFVDSGQPPRMNLFDYKDKVFLLSIIGLRLETEYLDLRWEEISNELGYTNSDFDLITQSFLDGSSLSKNNMNAFINNGRELVSKGYSYVSARSKEILTWLDSTISIRNLQSHRDRSSLVAIQWDGSIGDRTTFYLNFQSNSGKQNSELNFLFKNKTHLGFKIVW